MKRKGKGTERIKNFGKKRREKSKKSMKKYVAT